MFHPELAMRMTDEHLRDLRARAPRRADRDGVRRTAHVSLIGRFVVLVHEYRAVAPARRTAAPHRTDPTPVPTAPAQRSHPMGCAA